MIVINGLSVVVKFSTFIFYKDTLSQDIVTWLHAWKFSIIFLVSKFIKFVENNNKNNISSWERKPKGKKLRMGKKVLQFSSKQHNITKHKTINISFLPVLALCAVWIRRKISFHKQPLARSNARKRKMLSLYERLLVVKSIEIYYGKS